VYLNWGFPLKTTAYFREQVLRKRPYLKPEWCTSIIEHPIAREVQDDGRIRFWGLIQEYGDKAIRVVTLEDGETIHNAFPDSGYVRRSG
jgi:hypothetical protein